MDTGFSLTKHARTRLAQRNLQRNEIAYVLEYGRRFHKGGVQHVFLRNKDIPEEDERDGRVQQLVGTTVLLDFRSREVVTVYRNREGQKEIRKKPKYYRPPRC